MKSMRSRLIIFVICLFVLNGIGYAQSIKVTGQVIDEQNMEMPGVSVALKGASGVGTITDLDGNFTIDGYRYKTGFGNLFYRI